MKKLTPSFGENGRQINSSSEESLRQNKLKFGRKFKAK